MTARKGNVLLVILLIVAGVAVGAGTMWWWTTKNVPQPKPTSETKQIDETVYTEATQSANWKIYLNNKYGISFKYPETIFVNRDGVDSSSSKFWAENTKGLENPSDVYVVTLAETKYKGKEFHFPEIMFFVYKTSLGPEDWLKQNGTTFNVFEKLPSPGVFLYHSIGNKQVLNINGLTVVQFEHSETSTGGIRTLISNGKGLLVDITNVETGIGKIPSQTYGQILSTFKFL